VFHHAFDRNVSDPTEERRIDAAIRALSLFCAAPHITIRESFLRISTMENSVDLGKTSRAADDMCWPEIRSSALLGPIVPPA